ncbi:Cupredoxin [Artemisia annua]|uniref:Cupredoxin n=1 Tax=Artemisia annua TaxID=35608 RepID=A0A2U1PPE0_ARTAN|nr:Cupredoxin [Artemisia annua]
MARYNVALVGMMVVLSCVTFSSAKVYTVGDSAGWALGVDYNTWASDKTFKVGDKLVFNYDSSHTVDLVSSTDYTTCAIGNSIASYNTGTTTIALNKTGSQYFICGIPGHCTGGMQLTVKVTSSDDVSPSPAPLAAPSPLSADSPIATGNTLPNPTLSGSSNNVPVDSSSQAISPVVGFVFGLVVLILS